MFTLSLNGSSETEEKDKTSVNAVRNMIIFNLYNSMLNKRLDELTKAADPPFLHAGAKKVNWIQAKQMYILSAYVKIYRNTVKIY